MASKMNDQASGYGFSVSDFEDRTLELNETECKGASAKEKDGLEDTGKDVSSDVRAGLDDKSCHIAKKKDEFDENARGKNNCLELYTTVRSITHTELPELGGCHVYNAVEVDSGSSESIVTCTKKMRPANECQLPNEMVERVLAMIPFPQLLKVRAVSKTWYERFPLPSEVSSRQESKLPVLEKSDSFQKLISSVSSRWSVYCPVIVGDHGLLAYDPAHKLWLGLCVDLQQVLGGSWEPRLTSSLGPLICGVSQSRDIDSDLFMTNVLTKRSRKLPSHPNYRTPSLLNVIFDAPNFYKVLVVTEDPFDGPDDDSETNDFNPPSHRTVSSQLFDSRNGTWTMSQSKIPVATSFAWRSCSVYFDGLFYCLSGDDRKPIDFPLQLWVHDPEKGSWLEIHHPFEHWVNVFSGSRVIVDLSRFQLVVCGSKIMVVVALNPTRFEDRVAANSLRMFELDPKTRLVTWKSSGPPATVLGNSEHIASDGSNIYFCTLDLLLCCPVVVYNMKSGKWSCLGPDFKRARPLANRRWADFSFQPGLNPFISP